MRFDVLLSVCVSLATTSLSNGAEFSQVRDLPALKMGATELDAILLETHAFIDAANGPEDSGQETVNVSIDGQNIEIPHLSLASSVAFPNEVFGFSYIYNQDDKPISSVTIDLADSLRNRFPARASRPVEQISSRLCALSALFTLFSRQACASNLSPMRCRGCLGNSTILFSSTKGAVAILFALPNSRANVFRISPLS